MLYNNIVKKWIKGFYTLFSESEKKKFFKILFKRYE